MFKCKICSRSFKSLKSLQAHFSQTHNLSSKDYYDKFIKNNNEGICYCGRKTKYISITKGYHIYCSTKCQSNDKSIVEKRVSKNMGDNHWTRRNNTGPNKGKTYEEIHGKEKAKDLKETLSKHGEKLKGSNNPFFGKNHSIKTKQLLREYRIGKKYEEIYGFEKAALLKRKLMKPDLVKAPWRDYWSSYPLDFYNNEMRLNILFDQTFLCPICFKNITKKYSKNLHHINYIKNDNKRKNLIYLCISCHITTNYNRDKWKVYLETINDLIIQTKKLPRRFMLEVDKEQPLQFRNIIINRRIH